MIQVISSHFTSGITGIGTCLCDILGNHTAGTNHDVVADADRHDGGVRADAYSVSDGGLFPLGLIAASWATNSEWIVDEHRTVTDEAIISNGHEFANESVTLHACARANTGPALNLYEGAYEHIVAQCATIEVHGFDQCDVFTELNVDNTVLVDSGLAHGEGVANLSLEWVGSIMLKAPRGESVLMSGDGVEIEYRFFIPDSAILPPLGKGVKIIQCYLPKWKIQIENNLYAMILGFVGASLEIAPSDYSQSTSR